jgi:hypothetical protein
MITMYAIDIHGNRYRVDNNMYFFEETGIYDINNPSGHYEGYIIEIYLDGKLIFTSNKEDL